MADQISDTILDTMIKDDLRSRVARSTLIRSVREKILEIGYDSSAKGFDGMSCRVSVSIGAQSSDIAQGVDGAFEFREGEATGELDRQGPEIRG